MNCGSVLISGMKQQRSPSPIDSDIEEIFLEARAAAIRARDDPLPPSANSPSTPRPEEAPARSMADLAEPYRIDDAEAVLARSAANLPAPNPDASTKDADRVLTRSVAKLAMARRDNSINDAIDQLVDQLAAFCLQKVEQNTSEDDDIDISVEELEEEIRVRDNAILKGHS
jgi:hypothetical protein